MGIFLNPGNEGFQSALNSQIYIDKTRLLEYTNSVLDSEQRYICVSRPRHFGKSITTEMLAAYYDKSCDSSMLFQDYNIASTEHFHKHLNKYDVIHIDVNSFRNNESSSLSTSARIQQAVIAELREYYPACLPPQITHLPSALAHINKNERIKFIVIIDEWDAVFRENKDDKQTQDEYIHLLKNLFKDAPSKKFIKLAYMTGILPIKKYGTESALNNFDEFTMLQSDVLAEYAGFTEAAGLYTAYGMEMNRRLQTV